MVVTGFCVLPIELVTLVFYNSVLTCLFIMGLFLGLLYFCLHFGVFQHLMCDLIFLIGLLMHLKYVHNCRKEGQHPS